MRCNLSISDGVLSCSECGRPRPWNKPTLPKRRCDVVGPVDAAVGPGTEIAAIIKQLGGEASQSCGGCREMLNKMNRWGVDGCRLPENRAAIIKQLSESAAKLGLKDWLAAGVRLAVDPKLAADLVRHGATTDRPGAILALAIERACQREP